jgi:hypothetical protein
LARNGQPPHKTSALHSSDVIKVLLGASCLAPAERPRVPGLDRLRGAGHVLVLPWDEGTMVEQ